MGNNGRVLFSLLFMIKCKFLITYKLKDIGYQATSLSTYDFSTLYTTFPHNLIKENFLIFSFFFSSDTESIKF